MKRNNKTKERTACCSQVHLLAVPATAPSQPLLTSPETLTTTTREAAMTTTATGTTSRSCAVWLILLLLPSLLVLTAPVGAKGTNRIEAIERPLNHQSWISELDSSHMAQLVGRNLVIGNAGQPSTTLAPTTTTQVLPPVEAPDFNEPIGNHTVALGRDAQLSCMINNLGNFRTAWLRVEDKGILTIHNNIITRNYRVGLINNDDGKKFTLTIKNVQPSDKGGYMCQINSVPMKYAIGYLDVLTPPAFEDTSGSNQADTALAGALIAATTMAPQPAGAGVVTVSEGGNASLSCKASGHPSPVITWRREDNEPILLDGSSTLDGQAKIESPTIVLSAVSRLNSGAYLCIASNGVQPSASKRQVLDVQFRPVVRLPSIEVGAQLNQDEVKLSCYAELNPLGSYHWVKLSAQQQSSNRQQQPDDDLSLIEHDELLNSDKFEIVIKQMGSEKVQMSLTIRQVERHDFAWYKCIARNSLGTQSNSIRLYESSSFSLNSMFGRGGTANEQSQRGHEITPEHQNDQQQEGGRLSSGARQANSNNGNGSGAGRAHTRSSWIQRQPALGGRNQHQQDQQANALLDSASASSAPSAMNQKISGNLRLSSPSSSSSLLLLLFHCNCKHLILLLLSCFLAAALASRPAFVVVTV